MDGTLAAATACNPAAATFRQRQVGTCHSSDAPAANDCTTSTLRLALPSEHAARCVRSQGAGIAHCTGVGLSLETSSWEQASKPMLVLRGTPWANAAACYFVQKSLWLDGVLGSQ